MTEFQKKRLQYLINRADKCEWVQLGKGDKELLELVTTPPTIIVPAGTKFVDMSHGGLFYKE